MKFNWELYNMLKGADPETKKEIIKYYDRCAAKVKYEMKLRDKLGMTFIPLSYMKEPDDYFEGYEEIKEFEIPDFTWDPQRVMDEKLEDIELMEKMEVLRDAMNTLTPMQKKMILDYFEQNRESEEKIAKRFGKERMQYRRERIKIFKKLQDYCLDKYYRKALKKNF